METTDLATRLSLVSCQKGAWREAFFLEKLNFIQLEKTLRAAEKDAGGGVLKSAQDFFENTVYSIGLWCKTDAGSLKRCQVWTPPK